MAFHWIAAALLWSSPARAVDTDDDGLDDAEELIWGTDALDWDSDGDTVPDGAEALVLGTDPTDDERLCAPWLWVREDIAEPSGLESLATADVDLDGDLDLIAGTSDGVVWYPNHRGELGPEVLIIQGSVHAGRTVTAVDLDADGAPEVVAATQQGAIKIAPNLGGTFADPISVVNAFFVSSVAVVDLDGDGLRDLLYSDVHEGVFWAPNEGGLSFGFLRRIDYTEWIEVVAAGDLDADGDLDVTTGGTTVLSTLRWNENLGSGFRAAVAIDTSPAEDLIPADLDHDGLFDLVFAGDGGVAWLRSLGAGSFGPNTLIEASQDPTSLIAEDLDDNATVDVASASRGDGVVSWMPNRGDGVFGPTLEVGELAESSTLHVADLFGDREPDLVAASWLYGELVAWHSLSGSQDTDGDGLADAVEACVTGTDQALVDTDAGGTPDAQELIDLTDPTSGSDDQPLTDDLDADGLSTLVERRWLHTHPFVMDTDRDTFSDGDEVLNLGTDPRSADTDGDGMWDAEEIAYGTDPSDPDGDRDRLSDGEEVTTWNTDPFAPDTDGDLLNDGDEVLRFGTDPLVPDVDSDSDGLPDEVEASYGTDPTLADTDGDALQDGPEVVSLMSDPLAWDTDGDTVSDGVEVLWLGSDPTVDDRTCRAWEAGALVGTVELPVHADTADLDGDGDLDVFTASVRDNNVVVYDNLGAGVMGPEQVVATALGKPVFLEAFDCNEDGWPDLVYAAAADNELGWIPSLGTGAFGTRQVLAQPVNRVQGLVGADLDRDNRPDVMVASLDGVAWYRNRGNGNWGVAPRVVDTQPAAAVMTADLDGDGDADAVATSDDGPVRWYDNRGLGVFTAPTPLGAPGTGRALDLADLDGDGDIDVLAGMSWFENREEYQPRFVLARSLGSAAATSAAAADIDGDGDMDVITTVGSDVTIMWNLGSGAFSAQWQAVNGVSPTWAGAHDIDLDGDPDLLVADRGRDMVAWYDNPFDDGDHDHLSDAAELCLVGTDPDDADTDGGGVVDGLELQVLTNPFDPADDTP